MIHIHGLIFLVAAMGLVAPPVEGVYFAGFWVAPAAAEVRGTIEERDDYYVERIAKTFDIGAGGRLEVDTQRGAVRVESWDKGKVQVEVEKRADVFTGGVSCGGKHFAAVLARRAAQSSARPLQWGLHPVLTWCNTARRWKQGGSAFASSDTPPTRPRSLTVWEGVLFLRSN